MKRKTFFAVWNQYARTAAQRDDRLLWCSQMLGQNVESMKQLTDEDFDLMIAELRRLLRRDSGPQGSATVVGMDGKRMAPDHATKEQIWKIRQIEAYIRWAPVPERLEGFLRDKFRVDRPEQLTARNAWRAIEALVGVAAQATSSAGHKLSRDEKRAAMKAVKGVLKTWRP